MTGNTADRPIRKLRVPMRMVTWAEKHGVTTLRELIAFEPAALQLEHGLGGRAVPETAAFIEFVFGATWQELRSGEVTSPELGRVVPVDSAVFHPEHRPPPRHTQPESRWALSDPWETLAERLPPDIRGHRLDRVALPARMQGFVKRAGLETIDDLVSVPWQTLRSEPGLGRKTRDSAREALLRYSEFFEATQRRWEQGLLTSLQGHVERLGPKAQDILTRRIGIDRAPETLLSIAADYGVSKARISQIELNAWARLREVNHWRAFLESKFRAATQRGTVRLESLVGAPWWLGATSGPAPLAGICQRLLDNAWQVVELDEVYYLASCSQQDIDATRDRMARALKKLPLPVKAVRRELQAIARPLGPMLADALWNQLVPKLGIRGRGARAIAYGLSIQGQMVAFLAEQDGPIPQSKLEARFGRQELPDSVFILGPALVGLEKHFPRFQVWQRKIAPVATRLMHDPGGKRQWSCDELLPALREELELPWWLGHRHLAEVLKRHPDFRYLGRWRLALAGDEANPQRRSYVRIATREALDRSPEPLSRHELARQLGREIDIKLSTLRTILSHPPFVQLGRDQWGLLDRHLPGGAAAMEPAVEAILLVLERRQTGMTLCEMSDVVRGLSEAHGSWPAEACLTGVRWDPRFQYSVWSNAGLTSWESVRVPEPIEIMKETIEQVGGDVLVQAVSDRVAARYGHAPTRSQLGTWARKLGARVRGAWILV